MYDDGTIQGFFLFAGSVLKDMNSSLWKSWDLPGHLEKEYFPYLGSATVTVTSSDNMLDETLSKASKAAPNATAVVVFGGATHVTRKAINADGSFTFGGWVGKKKKTPHTVKVTAVGYQNAVATIQLEAGKTVQVAVKMKAMSSTSPAPVKSDDYIAGHHPASSASSNRSTTSAYPRLLEHRGTSVGVLSPGSCYMNPNSVNALRGKTDDSVIGENLHGHFPRLLASMQTHGAALKAKAGPKPDDDQKGHRGAASKTDDDDNDDRPVVPLPGAPEQLRAGSRPHILLCLVDDLGWNTVYNNDDIISPTIDSLAAAGVKLTSFYTYRYCSPTRASFLTGRLPYKLLNIRENLHSMASPDATDVRFTMLPKRLKEADYCESCAPPTAASKFQL